MSTYHAKNCSTLNDGPCDCGLEEVLEDELRQEINEDINQEEAPPCDPY